MRASHLVTVVVGLGLGAGCAASFQRVPERDWQVGATPAQRASIDNAYAKDVARTTVELAAARAPVASPPSLAHAPAPTVAPDDPFAIELAHYAHDESDARARVAADLAAWCAAERAARAERAAYLAARLASLDADLQLARARAIDHNLYVGDTYETGVYQAQVATAQAPLYAAQSRVSAAQVAVQRAAAELAAAKDSYADLVREGPFVPARDDGTLHLPAWRIAERVRWRAEPSFLKPPVVIAAR